MYSCKILAFLDLSDHSTKELRCACFDVSACYDVLFCQQYAHRNFLFVVKPRHDRLSTHVSGDCLPHIFEGALLFHGRENPDRVISGFCLLEENKRLTMTNLHRTMILGYSKYLKLLRTQTTFLDHNVVPSVTLKTMQKACVNDPSKTWS